MQRNNNLKIAISKDFDKTKNLKIIKERIEENNKVKNKNIILKYASGICCIALVIMGILLINGKNEPKKILDNGKDIIYINEINNNGQAKLDADVKILNIDENSDVFIKEVNEKLNIPTDLNNNKKYSIYVKENKQDDNYTVLNNYQFIYNNVTYDREIIVSFSKEFEPLRDYTIESKDNKESTINGIELTIYKYKDMYMTKFNYNDIYFDIETFNITENEFISLLQSIIK